MKQNNYNLKDFYKNEKHIIIIFLVILIIIYYLIYIFNFKPQQLYNAILKNNSGESNGSRVYYKTPKGTGTFNVAP